MLIRIDAPKPNGRKAILMNLDEYISMQETIHLMSNPTNAENLNKNIQESEQDLLIKHELID